MGMSKCTSTSLFRHGLHGYNNGRENMNGLIRQYIPKGTDFSEITDEFVAWVENKLNNRPRKRLGYLTPNEKFNLLLTG
jgi:IS30 family transposase